MLITLDQLNDVDRCHALHGAVTRLTFRAFDNNGTVPMRDVLQFAGFPFSLMLVDKIMPSDDEMIIQFKYRCGGNKFNLFSAYSVASSACETLTLSVKEKHGSLRAFKARNKEIARQIKIFKELFCCDDEIIKDIS